jgi:hypothetical protein
MVSALMPTKMPPDRPHGGRECHTKFAPPERRSRKLQVNSRLPVSEMAHNTSYDTPVVTSLNVLSAHVNGMVIYI